MTTKFQLKPDRHSQFVAQAMLLRAEYAHRIALNRATTEDVLVSPDTRVPSDGDLSNMYEDLMGGASEERPDTPHGALSYIELVLEIIAGEITIRYREEGGIVTTERDLGYALELLLGVRNWANHLDIVDAVEQNRAFHRQHSERRPQGETLSETAARSSTESSTATDWPDLHRRWSELSEGINDLEMDVHDDTLKLPAARKRAAQREYDRLKKEREQLLDVIHDRPIEGYEAIATLIDIAVENGEIDVPPDLEYWVFFAKVLKALRQAAPAIEFTAVRRAKPKSFDVDAFIANA